MSINLAFARHGLATEDEACHHGRIATTAFDQGGSSRLDPGDFVTLKAVAWNGQRHTIENLSASLSTTSAGVDITATELQWPAVWPFQSKENPERWTLQLASDLPCGELLNFAIRTQTAAGPDERQQSFQLRLGEYSGSPYQAQLPDLPITLRDNDTTVIPLTFAAASGLTAFQLQGQLTVDHPFPFDVRIDLVAPTGESYAVYRPRADDFEVAVDFSFTEAELKGVALTGTWQLVVTDQSAGDTGTLEQLAMTVLTDEFRCHKSVTKTD